MRPSIINRHLVIMNYINQNNSATIKELSNILKVSSVTVRRDLLILEEKRLLERFHGGVRKLQSIDNGSAITSMSEFNYKMGLMTEEKKRIGEKACEFINEGDIVFMNSGTTVLYFLSHLQQKNVTIITNNVAAIQVFFTDNIELLLLGGYYNKRLQSLLGEVTVNNIKCIYSNCTILGVNALDLEQGMTTSIYQECSINDAMIQHSRGKVVLLADHTKIGKIANFVSAPLSKIDVIVTDEMCPAELIKALQDKGVEVVVA